MTTETEQMELQETSIRTMATESKVQRIAVLRLGTLGDAMLTTPLYAGLKRLYPSAELTVIASQWNATIAKNHPAVDTVVAIPPGLRGLKQWGTTLISKRFDLYIDPKDHRSSTSRLVAEFIRAKRKLVVPGNLPLLSSAEIVPPGAGYHFVDSALAPLAVLAPDETFERRPSIKIPEHAIKSVASKSLFASTGTICGNERFGGKPHTAMDGREVEDNPASNGSTEKMFLLSPHQTIKLWQNVWHQHEAQRNIFLRTV